MLSLRTLQRVAYAGAVVSGGSIWYLYRYIQGQCTAGVLECSHVPADTLGKGEYCTQAKQVIRTCPEALYNMSNDLQGKDLQFERLSLMDPELEVSREVAKVR